MTASVRSVGTSAENIVAITPGAPAGSVSGDIWYLLVETNPAELPGNPDAVAWTEVGTATGFGNAATTGTRLTVWRHVFAGTTPALTVGDSGNHQFAVVIAVRDADTTNPEHQVTNGGNSTAATTVDAPAVTTTIDDCLVIAAIANGIDTPTDNQYSSWTNADLTSLTQHFNENTDQGGGGGIGIVSGIKAIQGSVAATTAIIASTAWSSRTIAIRSVTAGAPIITRRMLLGAGT